MIILKILLYVLLAVLGLVALILLANIGVSLRVKGDLAVYAHFLFIKINVTKLLSRQKKQKKPVLLKISDTFEKDGTKKPVKTDNKREDTQNAKNAAKEAAKSEKMSEQLPPKEKKSATELIETAKELISDFAKYFSKFARLKVKRLYAVASSDEPDKTAVLFGEMNIAVSSLLYVCKSYRLFKINENKVGVYSDFTGGAPSVDAEIKLSFFGWQIAILGIVLLMDYLRGR